MASDTRYLEQHGRVWRVVVPVPRSQQKAVGKTKLKVSLKTDSLKVANQLKWDVIAKLNRQITQSVSGTATDPLVEEAFAMREAAARSESHGGGVTFDELITIRSEQILGEPIDECVHTDQPIYDPERERLAGTFVAIASGRETPLAY